MKVYGRDGTHLELTIRAFKNYSDSDFKIFERVVDGEYVYAVCGGISLNNLTGKEVNDFLEKLGDEESY